MESTWYRRTLLEVLTDGIQISVSLEAQKEESREVSFGL
jgi:hypothetical protein